MSKNKWIESKSGIKVYRCYKDNICCDDKDNKALSEKAKIKRETYSKGKAKGYSRFGSESSEDALSWSVFRTLEINNKMDIFYGLINIRDNLEKTLFWTKDTSTESYSSKEEQKLHYTLDEVEPRNLWKIQQTEPDVILVGEKTVIFNESKLGRPNVKLLGWGRAKEFSKKHNKYKEHLNVIFKDDFKRNFKNLGKKFYQLMRNMIIGHEYAEQLGLDFHLSVVVNELNRPDGYKTHKEKFEDFSKYVKDRTLLHFTTWQLIKEVISRHPGLKNLHKHLKDHPCLKEK